MFLSNLPLKFTHHQQKHTFHVKNVPLNKFQHFNIPKENVPKALPQQDKKYPVFSNVQQLINVIFYMPEALHSACGSCVS